MTKRTAFFIWSLVVLISQYGCSYKLGNPANTDHELFVIVRNDSFAPQFGPLVNRSVREILLRKGIYGISPNRKKADFDLVITITNYNDSPESFRSDDSLLGNGFGLTADARVQLSDHGGTILYEAETSGRSSLFREDPTFEPNIEQALQALAEDLANQIYLSLLNYSP